MGYIDPGLFGMVSQIGLALFFLAGTVFMFFLNPLKKLFAKLSKKDPFVEKK